MSRTPDINTNNKHFQNFNATSETSAEGKHVCKNTDRQEFKQKRTIDPIIFFTYTHQYFWTLYI